MTAYYNEFNPDAAEWLRNLIAAGLIPAGDVDTRSIEDVVPNELRGYTQCHFFAGIGGQPLALRLAGWPDSRPVWTGSCPCQPFSAAGARSGFDDQRHLWPAWFHLIKECRPAIVFGEQVADAVRHGWIDLVQSDLEGQGYAVGHHVLGAHSVGAPHIRQRLWFVAHAPSERLGETGCSVGRSAQRACDGGESGELADARGPRAAPWIPAPSRRYEGAARVAYNGSGELSGACVGSEIERSAGSSGAGWLRPGALDGFWAGADWIWCRDDRWRPVEPGTFPLAHGLPASLGRASARIRELAEVAGLDDASLKAAKAFRRATLHGYGNAIVSEVAAQFIAAAAEVIGYPAQLQEAA